MEITIILKAEPKLLKALEVLTDGLLTSETRTNPTPAQSIQEQAPAPTAPMTPVPYTPAAPVMPPLTSPAPVAPTYPPQPVYPAPAAPQYPAPIAPLPTAAPSYSMDQLAVAATGLVDVGKVGDLMTLLGQYGCQALTQLPVEQYGNFATALRGLGAQI